LTTGHSSPWWHPLPRSGAGAARRAHPRLRLLLAPHSGSGPNTLLPVLDGLPGDVEVLGLCLPGRERRFTEPPGTTLAQVLRSVDRELTGRDAGTPPPTVAFGHSLGALLAVRIADRLGPGVCRSVVVSGQSPGSGPRRVQRADTDAELLDVLTGAAGTPQAVLRDATLRARLIALLRADLELSRQASQDFGALRLAVPLAALGADADPLVPHDRLAGWAAHISGAFRPLTLPGDHFALLDPANADAVRRTLTRALHDAADRPAPEPAGDVR
jgi:surfactin synthase thioesterase subunit